jgi:magnesium-transporting ATPase (P-type)
MNGSSVLYATTLTAMMCGVVLGLYVLGWMVKDLVRDKSHAGFKSVLFNFRLMMGLCGLAAVMACLPETLYLQMYGDPKVSETTQAAVMTGKRIADSLRIYVIIGWVGLLTMIYPYVCLALLEVEEGQPVTHLQVEDYPGLDRLWKPAAVFVTLAVIAMAFAFSKVYGA